MNNTIDTEKIRSLLDKATEDIHQKSEGKCPLCGEEDYPVCGNKRGYDEVKSEDAEEWALDHAETCPVNLLDQVLSLLPPPCSECGGSGEVPQSCDKCKFQRPNGCGAATACPLIPCPVCQTPNVMDYTVPKGFLLVKSDSFMGKIYDDFIKWLEKKDKQQNGTGQAPAGKVDVEEIKQELDGYDLTDPLFIGLGQIIKKLLSHLEAQAKETEWYVNKCARLDKRRDELLKQIDQLEELYSAATKALDSQIEITNKLQALKEKEE